MLKLKQLCNDNLTCGAKVLALLQTVPEPHATAFANALQLVVSEFKPNAANPTSQGSSSSSQATSTTPTTTTTNNNNTKATDRAFEIPNFSCLSPRGRHTIKLNATTLTLSAKKGDVTIPLNTVTRAYSLEKVDNYGKVSANLWLLVLNKAVPVGKQTTSTVVFSTPPKPKENNGSSKSKKQPEIFKVQVNADHLPQNATLASFEGTTYDIMNTLFSTANLLSTSKTLTNDTSYFTSSRQGPLMKCYSNVNDGLLYPVRKRGLDCFVGCWVLFWHGAGHWCMATDLLRLCFFLFFSCPTVYFLWVNPIHLWTLTIW